jgi:hypothetical protein
MIKCAIARSSLAGVKQFKSYHSELCFAQVHSRFTVRSGITMPL